MIFFISFFVLYFFCLSFFILIVYSLSAYSLDNSNNFLVFFHLSNRASPSSSYIKSEDICLIMRDFRFLLVGNHYDRRFQVK